jgi:hypothetical protein
MVSKYRIDRVAGHTRIEIPAFCRDSVIGDAHHVEIEASEDIRGKFLKLRPLAGV